MWNNHLAGRYGEERSMPVTEVEQKVAEALTALGIAWVRHEHPPVFTVEDTKLYWRDLQATHCKNLFLRNNKGNRHYLVIAEASKAVDLKALNRALGEDRLSFGSPERLKRCLGLEPGSVSPFGLLNNAARDVRVIVDLELRASERLGFHPNTNTATLEVSRADFERFLAAMGNEVRWLPV
jgi:Ala-tRNA(Pro) deacylase